VRNLIHLCLAITFVSVFCNFSCRLVRVLLLINLACDNISWPCHIFPRYQGVCREDSRKSNLLISNFIAFLDLLAGGKVERQVEFGLGSINNVKLMFIYHILVIKAAHYFSLLFCSCSPHS
jgi:hypothetical protein